MIENLTSLMVLGIALAATAVNPASGADRLPGVLRVGMPLILGPPGLRVLAHAFFAGARRG